MNAVNKGLKLIIVLMLCLVLVLPFSACKNKESDLTNGITVEPDKVVEYSDYTVSLSKRAIYGFLCEYHAQVGNTVLSEKELSRYEKMSEDIQKIIASENIKESDYKEYFESLEKSKKNYAVSLGKVNKGTSTEEDINTLKSAFNGVVALWGADAVGGVAYSLALYRYDCKYEDDLSLYEYYKNKQEDKEQLAEKYLESANKAKEDKMVLETEVKKENFISVSKLAVFVGELFFGGGMNGGFLSSLTEQEIALILTEPDFSGISVTDKGWELLLSLGGEGIADEYAKKLFRVLERTGDISVFAKEMQKAVRLITSVQKSVDKDMAKRLKDGDTDGFVSLVFERFTKENWSDFSAVTSVDINREEYNKAATEFYGKEFTDYVGGLTAYDLQDLKNAVGKEDFTKVLKGYLSGVCPAFTYGWNL